MAGRAREPLPGQVTAILRRMKAGDPRAPTELLPLVIGELRRLARHYMKSERAGHTLQPTALVNEAYLRLAGFHRMDWQSRSHFIGVAAAVMRQILVDYARRHGAQKRGAGEDLVPLDEARDSLTGVQARELVALDSALQQLAKRSPRQASIVELRYFGGLSVEETAEALSISPATVKREWTVARAWLRKQVIG